MKMISTETEELKNFLLFGIRVKVYLEGGFV